MKPILFFLLFLGVLKSWAQPVFQETDVFQSGTQATFGFMLNPSIVAGNAGANQQYNFQNVLPDYTVQQSIVLPPASPFGNIVPGNRVLLYNQGANGADHYSRLNGQFTFNGSASQSSTNPNVIYAMPYTPTMKMGLFPFQYGQQDSGVFRSAVTFFVGQDMGDGWVTDSVRRRTFTKYAYHFDGWGTLQTPGNNFQVLRQKIVYLVIDSVDQRRASDQQWFNNHFNIRTEKTEFLYWAVGQSLPVAKLLDLENDGFIDDCIWNVATPTSGIQEPEISTSWELFPNPATMQLNLKGNNFDRVSWRITDIQGREVKVGAINQSEGGVIGIQDLQPGLFFLTLERNGKRQTRRFVKQ